MLSSVLHHDGWNVGLVRGDERTLVGGSLADVHWLHLGEREGFAADPFLIEERGHVYCFFELLPYRTNRGKIAFVEIDPVTLAASPPQDAIVEPFHLSYPLLVRYGDEIVCVPEAGTSGRITAYVARAFPHGWMRTAVLLEGVAGVDATIFEHAGRWWMLATQLGATSNADLHCWFADDLFGRWTPHPANPVARTLAGSRPGGRPFVHDGRLYRPAQDCTARYGARLVINEILELTPQRFVERPARVHEPDPAGRYPAGLHTANAAGGVIAIDGNRLHFQPRQAARAIVAGVRSRTARLVAPRVYADARSASASR